MNLKENNNSLTSTRKFLGAALLSFMMWGILPIYWKQLEFLPVIKILCHRVIWTFVFSISILIYKKDLFSFLQNICKPNFFLLLLCSATCLGFNWLIYIWAINNGHILDASLGYYMTPLCNIFFGVLIFKNKLRRLQWLSILIAFIGVVVVASASKNIPWISIILALSFSVYAVVRKLMPMESLQGLCGEIFLLSIPAAGYLLFFDKTNIESFFSLTGALLVGSGIITTIPLLAYAYGARHLSLVTIGIMQFLTPSMAFLLGYFLYKEPITNSDLLMFGFIWIGIIFYTSDAFFWYKRVVLRN